jgi:hypothetical protein
MSTKKRFCTAINCMDGRTQRPVVEFLETHYAADFVDAITEPGPVKILAEGGPAAQVENIKTRLQISLATHGSVGVAVVAHSDCAGNPAAEAEQKEQLRSALEFLKPLCGGVPLIGLWLGGDWSPRIVVEA